MPSALIKEFEGLRPDGFPFGAGSYFKTVAFQDPGDLEKTLLPDGAKLLNGRVVLPNATRGHAWEKVFAWPVTPLIIPEYLTGFVYGFGHDAFETDEETKFCSLARYATMTGSGDVDWEETGGVCSGQVYRNVLADGFLKEWEWEFDTDLMTMGPKLNEEGVIRTTVWPLSGGDTCSVGAPEEDETTEVRHVGPITYTETTASSTPVEAGSSGTMEYELTGEVDLTVIRGLVSEWKAMPLDFRLATNSTAAPRVTETTDGQYANAAGGFARYRAAEADMPVGYDLVLDCVVRRNAPPYRDFNRGVADVTYEEPETDYVDVRDGREFAMVDRAAVDGSPMRIGKISGLNAVEDLSMIGAAVRLACRKHDMKHRVTVVWSLGRSEEEADLEEVTLTAEEVTKSRCVSDWAYWDAGAPGGFVSSIALSVKDGEDFQVERWNEEDSAWEVVPVTEPDYGKRYGSFHTGIRSPESEIWLEVKVVKGERRGYHNGTTMGWRKRVLGADLTLEGEAPEAGACGVTLTGNAAYEVEISQDKWGRKTITGDSSLLGSVNGINYRLDDRHPEMTHPWYAEPDLIPPQDHSGDDFEAAPVAVVARDEYPSIPYAGEEVSRTELHFPIRNDLEFGERYTEWRAIPDPPAGCYISLEFPRLST